MPEPLTISQIVLNAILSIPSNAIYDALKFALKNFNKLSGNEKEERLKSVKSYLAGKLDELIKGENTQKNLPQNIKDEILDLILNIIKDYNGKISVESTLNKGTTISVKFPKYTENE